MTESIPFHELYKSNRLVLACETVMEEMRLHIPENVSWEVLDFGLHLNPESLKTTLQEKIDTVSEDVDAILLGYGMCSMAVVGLQSSSAYLVIPKTDDCIAIFLGSNKEYKKQSGKEPGTYYLTKGWIEAGDTPFEEYQIMVDRYGEKRARMMTGLLLKNYKRLALINTGQYQIDQYRDYTKEKSQEFNLNYEEIPGSPALVQKLIFGPWDEEFVVVKPGESVKLDHFTDR